MKRTITDKLISWKANPRRKPLMLRGMRQCGKTYTLKEFGSTEFVNTAYFNFEKKPSLASIFEYDYDCNRILHELALTEGIEEIDITNTLVIFDEIQECPKAVTSLKYFCEQFGNRIYLVGAGSLLGPAISHKNLSFPVGKVEFLDMYPMSIYEFFMACGLEKELKLISVYSPERPLPGPLAELLERECRNYYAVGGMPEVVQSWITSHNLEEVDKILQNILTSYSNDFGKYLPPEEAIKVGWIWDSIPVQLAKENNKFIFSHVKKGKRSAELENALEWLRKAGLIYQLELVSTPALPLSNMADTTYFKVYMSDPGLLRAKAGVRFEWITHQLSAFGNFKGALTENFVMDELVKLGYKPYFWKSGNTAELDFMIEDASGILPIEAKAETNTKAKSYAIFCKRYNPAFGFKLSMNNVGVNLVADTQTYSVPLYLTWTLPFRIQHATKLIQDQKG